MDFPKTTKEEDRIAYEEGVSIFGQIRTKYPDQSLHHLDIILNSLCMALVQQAYTSVGPKDWDAYAELVFKIVKNNLNAIKNEFKKGN